MCYVCDKDRLLNAFGISAEYVSYKSHFGKQTDAFEPDGVGDLKPPVITPGAIVTVDNIGGDTDSAASLVVGAPSVVSTIDTLGDQDFYAIELVAGRTYDIGMYAKLGGPNAVPLADSFVELYDADGSLITSADGGAQTMLNEANSGFDVLLTFVANRTGTYYVNARAFDNAAEDGSTTGDMVGDYEIFAQDVTDQPKYVPYYDTDSPLYALDWGTQVDGTVRNPDGREIGHLTGNAREVADDKGTGIVGKNVVKIYFAKAGDVYTPEDPTSPGIPPAIVAVGAKDFERKAVDIALKEFEKVADVVFVETMTRDDADFHYVTYTGTPGPGVSLLGSMSPPQESDEGLAQFNSGDERWNATNLAQGGFSFVTLIHEFGHGMGMAHPHDNGGRSGIMRGVVADGPAFDYTTGDFDLNQGVHTMMSYEDGWQKSPYGNAETDVGYGYLGSLMAFDIAVIQDKYGVNEDTARGNDVYRLKDVNEAGTFYSSIWDTGGRDVIQYDGARDANIDLRAATLRYEVGGGGFVSYANGIFGGYTIANGVVIENATGGAGNDTLTGNSAANTLTGNVGNDVLNGGLGDDFLNGGAGIDTASYEGAAGRVIVDLNIREAQNTVGGGRDRLAGIENLTGTAGNDILTGNQQANTLRGGAGDDRLNGGANRDTLAGGAGNDSLTGGDGADVFLFGEGDMSADAALMDRILDFSTRTGDLIDLSGVDAIEGNLTEGETDPITGETTGQTAIEDAFTFIGTGAFSGTAGELRIEAVRPGFNTVSGDTDGDGVADFFISVKTDALIGASDFVL